MLSPELYPLQSSLGFFLQLQQELQEFLNIYYQSDSNVRDPRHSMFCSGVNYRTDEMHLGLKSLTSGSEDVPVFVQGDYFG